MHFTFEQTELAFDAERRRPVVQTVNKETRLRKTVIFSTGCRLNTSVQDTEKTSQDIGKICSDVI